MNSRKQGVIYMSKDRVIAFTDAILAIVMTILVLGLKEPEKPTLAGFWALRDGYFAYALSFFWLGRLWMTFNNVFEMVNKVDNRVVFVTVIMLFICSLIPYATLLAAEYFHTRLIQLMYGAIIILADASICWMYDTLCRADRENGQLKQYILAAEYFHTRLIQLMYGAIIILADASICWMYDTLCRADRENGQLKQYILKQYIKDLQKMTRITILIMLGGMAVAWLWYPPAMMYSIIFSALFAGILKQYIKDLQKMTRITILIMLGGMAVAWLWYPPAMMYSIIFSALFAGIFKMINDRRIGHKIDRLRRAESEKSSSKRR